MIARGIAHPAVAAPIAAGIDGTAAYLAVEYVVGDSLDVSSRSASPMPMEQVIRIVDAIAAAIDACAARGVHHGLLHPRDVIISAGGPRVTGFGIAQALSNIGVRLPARRPYAAPDGPSDVYSLAAIAYELISGRRMTPTGWDELSAEDGPGLRAAFAAALSPDARERQATAEEFAAALRSSGGSAPTLPVPIAVFPEEAQLGEETAQAVSPAFTPDAGPGFDADAIDPFSEAGAAADLHLEMPETPEGVTLRPSSWLEQPPRAFGSDETEPERTGRGRLLILALIALVVVGLAAYLVSSRRAASSGPATKAAEKPPVSSTTVDLPAAPKPVPPEPALPAPTPSRPASGAAAAPPVRTAVTGRLLIRTTPADASVTINGEPRGKTPLTVRDLPLGSYTIHVTRNGFADVDRRVRLTARRPSESMEILLRPGTSATPSGGAGPGTLLVESRPAGARVFVDGRLVGTTPLTMPDLPAGPAAVRIELDGYQTWATTVRVNAGEQTRVAASLDR